MKRSNAIRPPPFQPNLLVRRKFRFESSAAVTAPISSTDLFDLVVMACTSTTAFDVYNSVRLRGVEIWGPMASDLKPVTVSVEYFGSGAVGSPATLFSDTSMGSMMCAHVKTKPPKASAPSLWLDASQSATVVFTVKLPANSIIDVDLDLILQNGTGAVPAGASVAGATAGVVYVRSLDSTGAAALLPVSYPTI